MITKLISSNQSNYFPIQMHVITTTVMFYIKMLQFIDTINLVSFDFVETNNVHLTVMLLINGYLCVT